jgi:pentatricopeptide repeat protein
LLTGFRPGRWRTCNQRASLPLPKLKPKPTAKKNRSLEPGNELAHLADVYTYTTAISQCSSHHQLRRALELVAEMRARAVALNVHTYR